MNLELEITEKDLTEREDIRKRISSHLANKGLIICASDTCYSVAAKCTFSDIGQILKIILERKNMPFSVAVENIQMAEKYLVNSDTITSELLKYFTPGPITCISTIAEKHKGLSDIIHASKDGSIGIRIPESIETTIARLANCPITTVPAKIGDNHPIRDYDEAVSCIKDSLERNKKKLNKVIDINNLKLAAIKSNARFKDNLSTVVRIKDIRTAQRLEIVRLGYITKDILEQFLSEKQYYDWSIVDGVI